MNHFRSGEFARKAGVTVRTIRYYDRLGLLKPSAYSESGQRLYSELDFARLQQILTLKLIGLSLEEIKSLLTTDRAEIQQLLEQQKHVLQEQARQLAAVIQTIEKAQRAMHSSQKLDLEAFISIIKAVNMKNQADWLDQFYTDEQKEKLVAMGKNQSLADQKETGLAWKMLFEGVQKHMNRDVNDPVVQQLIGRWDELIGQFAGGDPDLATNLNRSYAHLDTALHPDETSPDAQAWTKIVRETATFIQRARAAGN